MKKLKYTIIKSQKQYHTYCDILEGLVLKENNLYLEEIELLTLLVNDFNERSMENYEYQFSPVEMLKDLLEENNITQVELSRRINVSPQLINDVLKLRREITKKLAFKLAEEFCVNPSVFLKPYELKMTG
jgi:antitoxin component HigA of HigAB toxin-antitoxin module